jgi:hypothetical protein
MELNHKHDLTESFVQNYDSNLAIENCNNVHTFSFLSSVDGLESDYPSVSKYLFKCSTEENDIIIYDVTKTINNNFYNYDVTYCCNPKDDSFFHKCFFKWDYNCPSSTISAPSLVCGSTLLSRAGSLPYIFSTEDWLQSADTDIFSFFSEQGSCDCPTDHSSVAFPGNPIVPISLCAEPPPTETSSLPTFQDIIEDHGGTYIANVECADDEPAEAECSLSAVSNVLSSFNVSDASHRVFYHQTANNLMYEHEDCVLSVDNDYGPDNVSVESYTPQFNLKSGSRPDHNTLVNYSFSFVPSLPTNERLYISVKDDTTGSLPSPISDPSEALTIKDESLFSKTFSFNSLTNFGEQNIAELNSYWVHDIPSLLYKDSVDLFSLDSSHLPIFTLVNDSTDLTKPSHFFSMSSSLSGSSDALLFQHSYSNSDPVFIKNQPFPHGLDLSTWNRSYDPLNKVYQYYFGIYSSIDLEYSFSPLSSLLKNEYSAAFSNVTITRREKINIFLAPFVGLFNSTSNYSYPLNYGVDTTFSSKNHSVKLVKGYGYRLL